MSRRVVQTSSYAASDVDGYQLRISSLYGRVVGSVRTPHGFVACVGYIGDGDDSAWVVLEIVIRGRLVRREITNGPRTKAGIVREAAKFARQYAKVATTLPHIAKRGRAR